MDALEDAKCYGEAIRLISALKWKCHSAACAEAGAHCRHMQTEKCLAGTTSTVLPDTPKQSNRRLGRRRTILVSQGVK